MEITNISISGFRNITQMQLVPCPGVNIIYGDNAQGKTNLIEALWLFTGAKSFRGSKERELMQLDAVKSEISIGFFGEQRPQSAQIQFLPKKSVYLNEILLSSGIKLAGRFYSVVFSPTHLSLIQDGPEERRSFIDAAICQLKPKYIRVLTDYKRVLLQRNQLLKDIPYSAYLLDTLDIWDQHFIRLTTTIIKTRYSYIQKLKAHAKDIYKGISREKECFDIDYLCKACQQLGELSEAEIYTTVANSIKAARNEDIKAGVSTMGANRDDIAIFINDLNIRQYGSQGQQRSAVLALKLAECALVEEVTGEKPVVLLDDVMSELDNSRKDYLLNHLDDRQIFITCCDKEYFKSLQAGKSFEIKEGKLILEESFGGK